MGPAYQLRSVSAVERESSSNDEERYVYDGSGQRCRKIRRALAKSRRLIGEVRYLPSLEVRTEATGDTLQVSTIQTGRNNVRVLHWPGEKPEGIPNNQIRYSLSDHLGSSALELDDKGELISQESYYPFGGTSWWAARSAVEAKYKTIRYSGKERDTSGLYYYGFRYYAPWLQRWVNTDPLNDIDGLNFYRFVGNRPSTMIDVGGGMETEPEEFFNKSFNKLAIGQYVVSNEPNSTSDDKRPASSSPTPNSMSESMGSTTPMDPSKEEYITSNFTHQYGNGTMSYRPGLNDIHRDDSYSYMRGHLARSSHKNGGDYFIVNFMPERWKIIEINKQSRSRDFFASDVIKHQYNTVSTNNSFPNQPPSSIIFSNVVNDAIKERAGELYSSPSELHGKFMTETELGKLTQHIADDLNMQAVSTTMTDPEYPFDITVVLAPRTQRVSPPTRTHL